MEATNSPTDACSEPVSDRPRAMAVERMLENIALSKARITNQQRGEEDQPVAQKMEVLEKLLQHNPAVFLERFHPFLCEDDIECFQHLLHIYEVDFYLKEARRRMNMGKSDVRVKNRRYEALKRLESEGSYFTDDAMRARDPLMYEQLVGQYLTDEELEQTLKPIDKSDLKFSTILMTFMDEQEVKELQQRQKNLEDGAEEEEEEEEEEDEDESDDDDLQNITSSKKGSRHRANATEDDDEEEEEEPMDEDGTSSRSTSARQPTPATEEEKLMLREEFFSHMRERFLSGEDQDFDYSAVDGNAEYDSLVIRERDEEENYFDKEDPVDAIEPIDDDDVEDYEKWTPEVGVMECHTAESDPT